MNVSKLNDGERREARQIAENVRAALNVGDSNKASQWLADDLANHIDDAFIGGKASPEYLVGCMAQATPKPFSASLHGPSWHGWSDGAVVTKTEYVAYIEGRTSDGQWIQVRSSHGDAGTACREALKDWRRQHAIASTVKQITKDITAAEDAVDPRDAAPLGHCTCCGEDNCVMSTEPHYRTTCKECVDFNMRQRDNHYPHTEMEGGMR